MIDGDTMYRTIILAFSIVLLAAVNLLFAQTHGSAERDEKRLSILKELEGDVPVWAGRYSKTSIDTVVEYSLAPESGVALALNFGSEFTTIRTGSVVAYSHGRLKLQWDELCDEPDDMCVIAAKENLALIRTGDIHRFFIDIAAESTRIHAYPHRKVLDSDAKEMPRLAPELKAFAARNALYAKVLDVDLVKVEKVKDSDAARAKRGRSEQFKLSQRMSIDFGSKAGIFEGLILYPARVGTSLEIKIVSVSEEHCIGQVDAVVTDPTVALRKDELVTTGRVKY